MCCTCWHIKYLALFPSIQSYKTQWRFDDKIYKNDRLHGTQQQILRGPAYYHISIRCPCTLVVQMEYSCIVVVFSNFQFFTSWDSFHVQNIGHSYGGCKNERETSTLILHMLFYTTFTIDADILSIKSGNAATVFRYCALSVFVLCKHCSGNSVLVRIFFSASNSCYSSMRHCSYSGYYFFFLSVCIFFFLLYILFYGF